GTGGLLPPARSRGALPAANGKHAKAETDGSMTWNPAVYGVGAPEMDEQHKRFFALLANLQKAERSGKGKEAVGMTLGAVMDYVKIHFTSEEEHMKRIGYPDLAGHRKKHEELARDAQRLRKEYADGKTKSVMKLYGFLLEWLQNHIRQEDKKYGEHSLHRGAITRRGDANPNDVISLDDNDFSHF
ncbi:MAG: hemerythrin family protein, partial [Nitrospinae bacterium]|nr:hemerythrin family protein [Nitrospinota bacterium]